MALQERLVSEALAHEINDEIVRQESLKAAGKFAKTCGDMADTDNLLVVIEELSEVAEAIDLCSPAAVREELIQVVACCVQWLQRPAGDYKDEIAEGSVIRARLFAFGEEVRGILDKHHATTARHSFKHPFNPEEVDVGIGVLRGDTCLDCAQSEQDGNHGE